MSTIKCSFDSPSNLTTRPPNHNSSISSSLLAPTHTLIGGTLAFALAFPFVVAHIRAIPLEPTGAVLVGSLLMLVFGVLTQADIYTILGKVLYCYSG